MALGPKAISDRLFKKYGVTLDYDKGGEHNFILDAPRGQWFNESWCHISCSLPFHGYCATERVDWKEVLAAAIEICEAGFTPCKSDECDYCEGEGIFRKE